MKRTGARRTEDSSKPTGNAAVQLFDMLLLSVNSIGIFGALIQVLGIPWQGATEDGVLKSSAALNGPVFFAGLVLCCVAAVFAWHGNDRKRRMCRAGIGLLLYVVLIVIFRQELQGGLSLLLKGAVRTLNMRYQFHIAWPDGAQLLEAAGVDSGLEVWIMTLGALAFCFPLELITGFFWRNNRCFCLAVGNGLWFTAACACNVFPDFLFLTFCVLGLLAVYVQRDFEKRPGAGFQAVVWVVVMAGLVMGAMYRLLLPVLDEKYEELLDGRQQLYQMVNEEWIPSLQNLFSGYGIGGGVDVSSELNRNNVFSYTSQSTYRVTLDKRPQGTVYLKGYVGGTYGKKEWEAQSDAFFENYYKKNGLDLPKQYNDLVNISCEALNTGHMGESLRYIQIEELGGKGSYSIYPYGAFLTEEYHVYSDGSVARKDKVYDFAYCTLQGNGNIAELSGELAEMELQYRQYVYDTFLEYPAAQLPTLTEALEEEDIRTDNVYLCATDIMNFLSRQADYNLDAGKNPSGTDFVEYFLFESHEGYCVHFASAAVLALRYFGIPARYVTGYSASASDFSANGDGGYTIELTGQQAHAWAEIYLDAIGWVPVEMTPGAVAFSRDNRREMLTQLGQLEGQEAAGSENSNMLTAETLGEKDTLQSGQTKPASSGQTAEPEIPETAMEPLEPGAENIGAEKPATAAEGVAAPSGTAVGGRLGGAVLFAVAAVVLLLFIVIVHRVYMWRIRHWHRALGEAGTNERISLLYRNMRRALHISGCPRQLNVVSEFFWQSLQGIYPQVNKREYDALCRILEKNTFGNVEPSAEEFQAVCMFHDRLVKGLYEKLPFFKKLYYKWDCCYGALIDFRGQ